VIEVEKVISLIIDPLLEDGTIGFYHYGNEYELKRVFALQNYRNRYPFVWLEMPVAQGSFENNLSDRLNQSVKLILATSSKKEWLNDRRNRETYDKVLVPLYNALKKVFQKSTLLTVEDNLYRNPIKIPNYHTVDLGTRIDPQKRQVNAYWDVLTMEFNGIFKNPCK